MPLPRKRLEYFRDNVSRDPWMPEAPELGS